MKCKKQVPVKDGKIVTTKNGRKAIKGVCGTCGTTVMKFVSNK
ncbi:hypothetical protein E24_00324 [Faustovirus]|nr:hypothetical protein E24_00324 [Faustovirus]AMN84225.1 hypothetical protein D5a_00321 [Faustovirus]AMN85213.1 hypothetical protein E23_00323 [Faustovirus]